ncbi:GreA/GreB family elongation factor [Microcella alkaliphila]|uniref:GreA/GreB family elongation factor n=1 Tax=Microcella alkaliphila TaxID=279828 RepID=A0A4Q7TN73_9MICO|nr:GreA/GreB family elongation factor [Microcella alkaliphila]RZT62281.1 GreA/GreB family elongation factor [Microcella alkaliphila]
MTSEKIWLTLAARQRLEAELVQLEAASQPSNAAVVRARELRELLRNAVVGQMPDDGLVEPGMIVTIRFDSDGSETTFLLGSRTLSELDSSLDIDVYSPTSPLGTAINGHYVGDAVTFVAPSGEQRISIVATKPFG